MKIVLTGVWRYVIKGWELICRADLKCLLDHRTLFSLYPCWETQCSLQNNGKPRHHPLLCLCRWKLLYLQPSAVMNTRWLKCNYVSLFMHSSCTGCYNELTCCICTIFYGVFERSNTLWKPYKTQQKWEKKSYKKKTKNPTEVEKL